MAGNSSRRASRAPGALQKWRRGSRGSSAPPGTSAGCARWRWRGAPAGAGIPTAGARGDQHTHTHFHRILTTKFPSSHPSRKTPNRNLSSDRHQGSKKSMEAAIGKLFDSVGSFFSGGDNIPWCDRDIIAGCEKEVAESGTTENKNDSLMRLSWALVHSRQPEDVNRGIAMLEASLKSSNSPLQMREKLYLLAVGHYRNGDYSRSRQLVERCLEIAPDWRQALSLKKVVEDKTARDGVIGIGIAATAATLVVGGIAAVVARKK